MRRDALAGLAVDWPAPRGIRAFMSTRHGGVSQGRYASLNLGTHVGDDPDAVAVNRSRLAEAIGVQPVWLHQVHGSRVIDAATAGVAGAGLADAALAVEPGLGCAVLVADCLPVLFCTRNGRAVAAAHAGWRGLAAGVLTQTVRALVRASGCEGRDILAWLGPCIGPRNFEVGEDVKQAFGRDGEAFFRAQTRRDGTPGWLCDLPGLARRQLQQAGAAEVHGGRWCTVGQPSDFFSFRRDGVCGRMAAVICRV